MATYSLFVIPIEELSFEHGWMTSPYQYYHSANGDTWNNNGPWSFTIERGRS